MPKQPIASLTASLLAPPSRSATSEPVMVQPAASAATVFSGAGRPTPNKPVAQTVKLEHPLFVRLKNHSANRRLSHQAIFVQALEEYLARHGG